MTPHPPIIHCITPHPLLIEPRGEGGTIDNGMVTMADDELSGYILDRTGVKSSSISAVGKADTPYSLVRYALLAIHPPTFIGFDCSLA